VISAVNEGEEYQLTELDPALVSRFNLYEFAPTVEDWLLWASTNNVDAWVLSFIHKHQHQLDGETVGQEEAMSKAGLVKTPDRRAWVRVSNFIKPHNQLTELHIKMIAGMVGIAAALAFQQSLSAATRVTAEDILRHFRRHQDKLKGLSLQEIILLNEQIMLWLNSKRYTPGEEARVREQLLAYLQYLRQMKQQEAMAHFASFMENPRYEHATSVVAASLEIITLLTDYVQGIQV
jgi:hypothetical protein